MHITLSHLPMRLFVPRVGAIALITAALLLAYEPAAWLFGTWHQQGYDGIGWIAAAMVAGLCGWSLASPIRSGLADKPHYEGTVMLLAATALIRLSSQLLDVSVLGALLLSVDVFALARLARLPDRARAISACWLAVLFCFSLPIEPILQRVFGFLLQQISASLACGLLWPLFDSLICDGVRLSIEGRDVLVDVPCSGAELVSTTGMIFSLLCTLRRPTFTANLVGAFACLGIALAGNALRIALLATGIVLDTALPFQVMDPLPHTLIGLGVVGLACFALLVVTNHLPSRADVNVANGGRPQPFPAVTEAPRTALSPARQLVVAVGFLSFALVVGSLEPAPVDASPALQTPALPRLAAGYLADPQPLTEQEQRYFTRYGGAAQRASYGPYGLLLVSTASPLRHLHDPAICLSAMGYDVALKGTDHPSASTVYKATAAERYTLRVSYVSSDGRLATSISEVVWLWLSNPTGRWTMVQRVIPEPAPDDALEWESAIRRAFNIS